MTWLLRGVEGEVRQGHDGRLAQTAGVRGGPGYGESLSSLSVDLRMVINYSINSDQTQEEEVCPVATMMVMVPGNPNNIQI